MHLKHTKKLRTVIESALPKTGHQYSYYPGDDGYHQMGVPTQGNRFIDNGDGTITDRVTGLTWVKDPASIPGGLFASPLYWYDAIDACENLNYAGYDDWRLPNINELMSLIDHSRYEPAFDTLYFTPPVNMWTVYWSSSICAPWTDGAWTMYAYDGYKSVWGIPWDMCTAWPVRGGKS